MLTAIVSDLHLGTRSGADVVRAREPRLRLLEAIEPADRVVLLGDLLELREQPARTVLELARPLLDGLGDVTAGKQVVIVPGNHDHQLVAPALDHARLSSSTTLEPESVFSPERSELGRHLCARMPQTEVVLAYPGIRLRRDVYATHGHYLDLHLTVPRLESVIASAVARVVGGPLAGAPATPERYEAALAPIYAVAYGIAQNGDARAITRGGDLSRSVWSMSSAESRRTPAAVAIRRIAIPAAVAALNLLGLGPFRADISGAELHRAGLRAMGEVVRALGIEAEHVIFGHTHRAGPLADEGEGFGEAAGRGDGAGAGWRLPGGTRLTNTGSWLHERVFVGAEGRASPYWPGMVTMLRDEGAPELTNALAGVDVSTVGVEGAAWRGLR